MNVFLEYFVYGLIFLVPHTSAMLVDGKSQNQLCVLKNPDDPDHTFMFTTNFQDPNCMAKGYVRYGGDGDAWNYLYIETSMEGDDVENAYAAGAAEAELTRDLITQFSNNTGGSCYDQLYVESTTAQCEYVEKYLSQQARFIYDKFENHSDSEFWRQAYLGLVQLSGFQACFEYWDLFPREYMASLKFAGYLQVSRQMIGDIMVHYEAEKVNFDSDVFVGSGHTYSNSDESVGIVRMLSNDILLGHTTVDLYSSMIRLIKRYNFPFHRTSSKTSGRVPGRVLTFSSYPGVLYSPDSFIIANTQIAQISTFQNILSYEPFRTVNPDTVPEWLRAMVSARLASTAAETIDIFKHYPSGYANNLRIVVDYNAFDQNPNSSSGIAFLAEETPLLVWTKDITSDLRSKKFFAISNIPYTYKTQEEFGYVRAQTLIGDMFDFEKAPVHRLIKRLIGNVTNLEEMKAFMRYNNYQHDNESRCETCDPKIQLPSLSIAPRIDLLDDSKNDNYVRVAAGAIDAKVTSRDLVRRGELFAAFGPPHGPELPPFEWKNFPSISITGQARRFAFKYTTHDWHFTPEARHGRQLKKRVQRRRRKSKKQSRASKSRKTNRHSQRRDN